MSGDDDRLVCNACQLTIRTADDRATHYKSEWHRYNVKRRCAGLQPVSSAFFSSQLSELQQRREAAGALPKVRTRCQVCGKVFGSKNSYDAHLLSKKHAKLERQHTGEAADDAEEEDDEDDDSGAQQLDAAAEQKEAAVESAPSPTAIDAALSQAAAQLSVHSADDVKDGSAASSLPPSAAAELYDGYELQPGEAPIPLLSCVYCTLTFDSVSSSLSHMHRDHGFFIPFPSHLASVESLLQYLGEKVGIGHCCVYCSARFGSTQAVRQHMREKSHAKLRLDSEEDEDEYTDYYDFDHEADEQQADGGHGDGGTAERAAVGAEAGKRRLAGMSDSGELVMTDGSTIGHRQYARVYQQHVRLVPQPPTPHQQQQEQLGRRRGGELVATGSAGALVAVKGGVRDTGKRYRESWVRKNERRLALKVGMRNNMQAHFRAQVLF